MSERTHSPALAQLSWLPLVLLLGVLLASALTGRAPVQNALAAVNVPVTGSVDAEISIDTSACLPPSVTIGEILPGTDPWKTAQHNGGGVCSITFGSTNVWQGVNLDVLEDPSAPASPADAMKCVSGGCSGQSLTDYSGGTEPATGTSAFGAQLLGSGGGATAQWAAQPAVHPITDAGTTACSTAATGDGTCQFTFGATAAASDVPGSYEAEVQYLALAR